jgi:hypothetical protein
MTHYGLKRKDTDGWLRDQSGMIFWVTNQTVADEQRKLLNQPSEYLVCAFTDDGKTEQ